MMGTANLMIDVGLTGFLMKFLLVPYLKDYVFSINATILRVVTLTIYSLGLWATTVVMPLSKVDNLTAIGVKHIVDVGIYSNEITKVSFVVPAETWPVVYMTAKLNLVSQLWTSTRDSHETNVILQGSWQSCLQDDGSYGERAYELRRHNQFLADFHMGPRDEFALYSHWVDGLAHTHDTPDNLLGQAYRMSDVDTWRGKRQWTVPKLHLWLSIVRAGGSRDECQSFYIRMEEKR